MLLVKNYHIIFMMKKMMSFMRDVLNKKKDLTHNNKN